MNKFVKGYLLVILSAVIYGFMPLGAKIIYADGVNPISLVLYRNCLSIPLLALLVKVSGEPMGIGLRDEKKIFLLALFGSGITPILLFASYNHISSGMATVLHFIYPAAVVVAGVAFLKEKMRISQLICVLICTAGVCIFYAPGGSFNLLGSCLALLSGITYAGYILLLDKFHITSISVFKLCLYISINCSAILLTTCLLTDSLTLPNSPTGWLACVAFSLCVAIGAVGLFQSGTMIIGAQRASILSTFEPITSLVVGVLVFHEQLTGRSIVGALLILSAVALIAVGDMRGSKQRKAP